MTLNFRAVGYTDAAVGFQLSPAGFAWVCSFNGIAIEKAPKEWGYAPNEYMRQYIELKAMEVSMTSGETLCA